MTKLLCLCAALVSLPAMAGPPFLTDDPETPDAGHYEVYAFSQGSRSQEGTSGEAGIDFNYGAAPDWQLTAVLPVAYDEQNHKVLGNIELAVKYRFLHQEKNGVDVGILPRVFLPSVSDRVGAQHAALLIPLWAQKDFEAWSVFGGGGCVLNHSGADRNYCLAGIALTRDINSRLHVGGEIFHQTADVAGGKSSTALGGGITYDLSANYHLLAYWGPGIQNRQEAVRSNWYGAALFTF